MCLLKKELKILELYRKYTLLSSIDDEINIKGDFFIHDDCDEYFEYFRKNEYLKWKQECEDVLWRIIQYR